MSDEFNVPHRTFADGHDPMWTALDKPDEDFSSTGRGSLHFYNSSSITTTEEGHLKISTTIEKTEWEYFNATGGNYLHRERHFKSGMIQGWNKFCFTGGIVEVDVKFPGRGHVGGLWPAIWILGNLGRATYEASTNLLWPWSFDTCDRELQLAQTVSACNEQNHYGLQPHKGRGATEIDIVEVMYGEGGALPNTIPPVEQPYADFTLQVAPGVRSNRPPFGFQPLRAKNNSHGFSSVEDSKWYPVQMMGNTSLNPYFYGTYLDETKPGEPVTRGKKQAFQADAVCAMNQLVESHFDEFHTFRLEWQPGEGGRLDWFVQGYKINDTHYMTGDGRGKDWYPAYTITDDILKKTMGSQIPIEPSYLIINTAISSTWGFPYITPDYCTPCFDCIDRKCQCNFNHGFCEMLGKGDVAMYIDSVRVYQSRNASAHVGAEHSLGCDPPEFPTRQFIKGSEYKYVRSPPWSYTDLGPLRPIQNGGGKCATDADCGSEGNGTTRGACGDGIFIDERGAKKGFSANVCTCNEGFTGPHCLAIDHVDDFPSAYKLSMGKSMFLEVSHVYIPPVLVAVLSACVAVIVAAIIAQVSMNRKAVERYETAHVSSESMKPLITERDRDISGRSI